MTELLVRSLNQPKKHFLFRDPLKFGSFSKESPAEFLKAAHPNGSFVASDIVPFFFSVRPVSPLLRRRYPPIPPNWPLRRCIDANTLRLPTSWHAWVLPRLLGYLVDKCTFLWDGERISILLSVRVQAEKWKPCLTFQMKGIWWR